VGVAPVAYFAGTAVTDNALLTARRYFDVRDELRIQGQVQAVSASRGASGIDGVNDHAKDRESGSFDVGRLGLTRAVTASMLDWSACAFFSVGRTLVSTNLATFTVSLAAVARACSTLVINALILFLLSRPMTPGRAVNQNLVRGV
jgi:hypothetical protein